MTVAPATTGETSATAAINPDSTTTEPLSNTRLGKTTRAFSRTSGCFAEWEFMVELNQQTNHGESKKYPRHINRGYFVMNVIQGTQLHLQPADYRSGRVSVNPVQHPIDRGSRFAHKDHIPRPTAHLHITCVFDLRPVAKLVPMLVWPFRLLIVALNCRQTELS